MIEFNEGRLGGRVCTRRLEKDPFGNRGSLLSEGEFCRTVADNGIWTLIDRLRKKGFEFAYCSHAEAILCADFPEALIDLATVLRELSIAVEDLVRGGGGEAKMTQGLRRRFRDLGWKKHEFEIKKLIDGTERESISHEVDHVRKSERGQVALEIEWNNKDPFFDRDLENFKRLHAEGAISVGIILTRGKSLQEKLRSFILAFAKKQAIRSHKDLERYGVVPTRRQQLIVEKRMRSGVTFQVAWSSVKKPLRVVIWLRWR